MRAIRRISLIGRALLLLGAFVLLALSSQAQAAHAPAGYVIENQATASLASGETYLSNVVQTVVLPLCAPDLVPSGTPSAPAHRASVTPGGQLSLPYRLTNAGNDRFTFALSVRIAGASEWNPTAVRLYLDQNANGAVDTGDLLVSSLELGAGESAPLLLYLEAPATGSGLLWLTPVARCPNGTEDTENYAEVRLASGPALEVEKRFAPAELQPGETTTVEIRVRNLGDQPTAGEVVLEDDLSSMGSNFTFVPGSAEAPKGLVEYRNDLGSWQDLEPPKVTGLRLRLPGLEVGEEAYLRFKLRVSELSAPGLVENKARAEGPGGPAEVAAQVRVLPRHEHYLGPRGNPRALPGGEGSEDDRQSARLIEGQPYCFEHTLENASNLADEFDLRIVGLPSPYLYQIRTANDAPLALPVYLEPGQSIDFKLCLTAPSGSAGASPFEIRLDAVSKATRRSNATWDAVLGVYPADALVLTKTVNQTKVPAQAELQYVLTVENRFPFALTNLVIQDDLNTALAYVSSEPEATYDSDRHRVIWKLSRLKPGERWQAVLRVRVKQGTPDDTQIANQFSVRAEEYPVPATSPEVITRVWSTGLLLKKSLANKVVRIGDRLRYTLELFNPSEVELTLDLVDEPDPHLRYIAGSGDPAEPKVEQGRLIWRGLRLGPKEKLVFTYEMRVLPGAPKELRNRAQATGKSAGGTALATGWVEALGKLSDPVFAERKGTLVGRVFLDSNRDGLYEEDKDLPLPGARIVLSDGRQAVTDAEGRYAFRDLAPGVWLVGLDPESAPFPPLPHPEALQKGCMHRVSVYGLAVSDFPLAMPEGWIRAVRSTRLSMGPLLLEKKVMPLRGKRFRVVLVLRTAEPLPEFELRDPLPGGGVRVFRFDRFEGGKTLTYDLEGPMRLTDPEVRWRYP